MKLTAFFHALRSAYAAELDDLTSDSEGKDVLRKRLAEKRRELDFLVQMMELSPEMVAVVFHRGFRFGASHAALDALLTDENAQPDWHALSSSIALEPWAQPLAQRVLQEPQGAWFLAVTAALEYLQQHPRLAHAGHEAEGDDAAVEDDDADDDYSQPLSADDAADRQDDQAREEASADWLADQGFDRKD